MSFGQNLQFLRKMHKGMTQDELAEIMGVSRQTVSKWEMNSAYPEMEKAIALCSLFSCTLDDLMRDNMNLDNEAYSNIRTEKLPEFKFVTYTAISAEPEDDALNHIKNWAACCKIKSPEIIGWDFPFVSQEQINVYHMHGYSAACIINDNIDLSDSKVKVNTQPEQKYAVITIKDPFTAPFSIIPNAYKALMKYMEVNNMAHVQSKYVLPCFEKQYEKDGVTYMDVYIAVEK